MASPADYSSLLVLDLKKLLKDRCIEGRSKITKRKDIINALTNYDSIQAAAEAAKKAAKDARIFQLNMPARRKAHEAAIIHNSSSGLYRLPVELRNVIYKDVLPDPGSLTFTNTIFGETLPATLQVCTLFCAEATALYYGTQAFNFWEPKWSNGGYGHYDTDTVSLWLGEMSTFSLPMLSSVRKMEVQSRAEFKHSCGEGSNTALTGRVTFRLVGHVYYFSTAKVRRPAFCECTEHEVRRDVEKGYEVVRDMVEEKFGGRQIVPAERCPVMYY
ncbi:hypothetical protein LTR85_008999 [Meristemomyces frigidus]|nr:hypothetical protein LTR85_008999 [Meristemomyces frigidus]